MLALGLEGGSVMMVDEETGQVKWEVESHSNVSSLRAAMSPGGRFVASLGSRDTDWALLDAANGAVHREGARQTELVRASAGGVTQYCRHALWWHTLGK